MSLSGFEERNLEAAIIGAQMLINNPEAAVEILLGSDIYRQVQEVQHQGLDPAGAFSASRLVHSEQHGQLEGGSNRSQPTVAGSDASTATSNRSQVSAHAELPASLKTNLNATVQALLRNVSNPHTGMPSQQQGVDSTRVDTFAESQRLLAELSGPLEAGSVIRPPRLSPAVANDPTVQALLRSSAQQGAQPGVNIFSEARRLHNASAGGARASSSGGVEAMAIDGPDTSNSRRTSGDGVAASLARQQRNLPQNGERPPILLYNQGDDSTLSRYQCLVRQQIEMFEATDDDVQFNISRMSKIIVLGQVGIRCRHCSVLPEHSRPKAAVYYPRTLDSIYQFGQNMVKNHLLGCCELIPKETKHLMMTLQESRKRGRGGRDRWAQAAHEMGVVEDENGLRFA